MAASRLGGSFLKYVYHSSSPQFKNPGQFFFFRAFSCTLFVKDLQSLEKVSMKAKTLIWRFFAQYNPWGISFSTTNEGLADSFSQFGKVVEAKVVMNKVKNRSKGYGYVTFAEEAEARKALTAMNGQVLDGRVIYVDEETRSHPRTPR